MAPNTNPIDTQTILKEVDSNDLQAIKDECDDQGAAGYELKAAYVKDKKLVLIFQLTR